MCYDHLFNSADVLAVFSSIVWPATAAFNEADQ
jgi:hypothetical protein